MLKGSSPEARSSSSSRSSSRGAARVARLMALRGSSKGGSHSTPTPKALSAEPHE